MGETYYPFYDDTLIGTYIFSVSLLLLSSCLFSMKYDKLKSNLFIMARSELMEKRQKKILSFLNKLDDQKLELLYELDNLGKNEINTIIKLIYVLSSKKLTDFSLFDGIAEADPEPWEIETLQKWERLTETEKIQGSLTHQELLKEMDFND